MEQNKQTNKQTNKTIYDHCVARNFVVRPGSTVLVTMPKIAGLEYWVLLLYNFTPVSVRQV